MRPHRVSLRHLADIPCGLGATSALFLRYASLCNAGSKAVTDLVNDPQSESEVKLLMI